MRFRINEPWVPYCMQKAEPEGPLVAYLRPFAQSLIEQGYFGDYLRRHVMLAMYFSQWLKKRDIRARCVTSEHSLRYLRYRDRRRESKPEDSAAVRHLMMFLRSAQVIPADVTSISSLLPIERVVHAHGQYLGKERALTSGTICNYGYFVRDFLSEVFGTSEVRLSCLSAADVIRYVQRRASRLRARRAKYMTTALRSFFRYVRWRGAVKSDLAAAVPTVPLWSMASIPRDITAEQTRKLLASIDRSTALGCRNYAILLILARLGLRSGEVKSMELDDIDWRAGQLMVRGKASRHHEMPLPADVGQAIAAYLQHGRPNSSSRRLFLRSRAPYRGFARDVGMIARRSLQRAKIKASTYGTHQFRHGLASQMLRRGASLAEIGAVLGHQHPDTTRIYTKIDLKALQALAQPWPRGVG